MGSESALSAPVTLASVASVRIKLDGNGQCEERDGPGGVVSRDGYGEVNMARLLSLSCREGPRAIYPWSESSDGNVLYLRCTHGKQHEMHHIFMR